MVELALVLPVLLSIIFGCLELAKIFKLEQVLSSMSREGANAAFRGCAPTTSPSSCLSDVYASVTSYGNSILPGAELVLSIYDYNPPGPNPITQPATVTLRRIQGISLSTGLTPRGNRSRFVPAPLNPLHPNPPTDLFRPVPPGQFTLTSLTNANRVVTVGEVFYRYVPPINMPKLPFFKYFSSSMYEVTVF